MRRLATRKTHHPKKQPAAAQKSETSKDRLLALDPWLPVQLSAAANTLGTKDNTRRIQCAAVWTFNHTQPRLTNSIIETNSKAKDELSFPAVSANHFGRLGYGRTYSVSICLMACLIDVAI
jgi:hypothetical protein